MIGINIKGSEEMRVFILGLDGLEYDFVQKWNLKHLKQQEYSKIEVPIESEEGVPMSPEVWASFLTGKQTHLTFEESPIRPLTPLLTLLKLLRRHINLSLGLSTKIRRKTPEKLHKRHHVAFPPLKDTTFLDVADSKEINVPYYSYDHAVMKTLRYFGDERISLQKTAKLLISLYEKRKEQILNSIRKNEGVDILFAFMHFPDVIQHLLFTVPSKIQQHYMDLDNYVLRLKNKLNQSIFLIVSDHGFSFETETHSLYGFYSSNKTLNPKPKQITDFYNLLLQAIDRSTGPNCDSESSFMFLSLVPLLFSF